MALLETPAKNQNLHMADFRLKSVDGKFYTAADIKGQQGTVIAFICNHCPYVKAIIKRLVPTFELLQQEGFGCIAIMPNDTQNYPADSFENMALFAKEHHFTFPYVIDETQEVARTYGAVCTPDLFGFDADGVLQYRGRLDSAGPNQADPDTKPELLEAMRMIAAQGHAPDRQHPSMGCSIKWKSTH